MVGLSSVPRPLTAAMPSTRVLPLSARPEFHGEEPVTNAVIGGRNSATPGTPTGGMAAAVSPRFRPLSALWVDSPRVGAGVPHLEPPILRWPRSAGAPVRQCRRPLPWCRHRCDGLQGDQDLGPNRVRSSCPRPSGLASGISIWRETTTIRADGPTGWPIGQSGRRIISTTFTTVSIGRREEEMV